MEGIVSKRALSTYKSGPSSAWLKTKCWTESVLTLLGFEVDSRGLPIALLAKDGDDGLEYAGGALVGMPKEVKARVDTLAQIARPPIAVPGRRKATGSSRHFASGFGTFAVPARKFAMHPLEAWHDHDAHPHDCRGRHRRGLDGLRVTCPNHGSRSLSWLALARDGDTRVALSSVVHRLRCHQCHRRPSEVLLESETGSLSLRRLAI